MLKDAVIGGPKIVFSRMQRADENQFAKIRRREIASKGFRLRRQRIVSKQDVGRNAVRQGWSPKVATNEKGAQRLSWSFQARQVVWVPRKGHRGAERIVAHVRRNAADLLQQIRSQLGGDAAEEGAVWTEQTQTDARPTKAGGCAFGPELFLYTPLLKWYLEHGLKISVVYGTINYRPQKLFTWFVYKVMENRRRRDETPDQALLAEVF